MKAQTIPNRVEDRWPDLKQLLPSDLVAKIEQRESKSLVTPIEPEPNAEFIPQERLLIIKYVAARGGDTAWALQKLAQNIVDVSKKYEIKGSLKSAKAIEFDLQGGDVAVVSYLLFSGDDGEKIDEEIKSGSNAFILENGEPK